MIDEVEIRNYVARWSVSEKQIRHDHLLSHLIHAVPETDEVVFIGGTALNRTYLRDQRLSEDLDIFMLEGDPVLLVEALREGVRLEFPDLEVEALGKKDGVSTYNLRSGSLSVRLQIVTDRPTWRSVPRDVTPVLLRYSDLPETKGLHVPTADGFTGMKLAAWADRRASRDLFDLGGLARHGLVADEGVRLACRLMERRPVPQDFDKAPSPDTWYADLGNQMSDPGDPNITLDLVCGELAKLLEWEQ